LQLSVLAVQQINSAEIRTTGFDPARREGLTGATRHATDLLIRIPHDPKRFARF
jgi:hypothetical protein